MKPLVFLESIIQGLDKIVSKWNRKTIESWFHGFIQGDGSYTCRRNRPLICLETSRLGTLACFLVTALKVSDNNYVRIYGYLRKECFSKWKIRACINSKDIHHALCSLGSRKILEKLSNNVKTLAAYTAGFIDSDGTIVLSVKRRFRPRPHYYLEPEIYYRSG